MCRCCCIAISADRGPRTEKFDEYWQGEEARFVEAFRVSSFFSFHAVNVFLHRMPVKFHEVC